MSSLTIKTSIERIAGDHFLIRITTTLDDDETCLWLIFDRNFNCVFWQLGRTVARLSPIPAVEDPEK